MDEIKITKMACARIPTDAGEFQLCLYRSDHDQKEHLALIRGEVRGGEQILARVHSECFTGDVLASRRCDCGEQLQRAILSIAQAEAGVLIYLRQEGRGIGLLDKLRAYNLQDQGFDTVEANLVLGHQPDERDYSVAAGILKDLGVASIRLLTNNPDKISRLEELGVAITGRVPLETTVNADNAHYLFTKAIRMNHLLNLETIPAAVDTRKNGTH
ncbi:MAG TPA: GTP cyclohydrolase II [Anaerolineales bacterium]|nr:GTP cyclohydrolase II [Anaerolineales bacterium]